MDDDNENIFPSFSTDYVTHTSTNSDVSYVKPINKDEIFPEIKVHDETKSGGMSNTSSKRKEKICSRRSKQEFSAKKNCPELIMCEVDEMV